MEDRAQKIKTTSERENFLPEIRKKFKLDNKSHKQWKKFKVNKSHRQKKFLKAQIEVLEQEAKMSEKILKYTQTNELKQRQKADSLYLETIKAKIAMI